MVDAERKHPDDVYMAGLDMVSTIHGRRKAEEYQRWNKADAMKGRSMSIHTELLPYNDGGEGVTVCAQV